MNGILKKWLTILFDKNTLPKKSLFWLPNQKLVRKRGINFYK